MGFTLARLLIHDEHVPPHARGAVRAAYEAPIEQRNEMLYSAARIVSEETELECEDVRELFGLSPCDCR